MDKILKTILVVDDRRNSLKVLAAILADEGFEVLPASNPQKALELYAERGDIDAVLSDLKMPGMDGLELFRRMRQIRTPPAFVIMTAYGTVKSAVQALKTGITNYLIKPLDYEELVIVLNKAIRECEMVRELKQLSRHVQSDTQAFHGIIGNDPAMMDIFDTIRTVGPTDASVLIYGETGTGKELLARALHLESTRREQKMVCINSVALAENLLEAELFGYVKGAFTGAVSDRQGRLEAADGSTLFLDEIGYMSIGLQAKLLRFLQEKSFEPVGGSHTRHVDVRILAATNLDLRAAMQEGRFLNDLFYRIEVISIHVPPLRERRNDIYLLVNHFAQRYARQYGKSLAGIDPQAMEALIAHDWPGNVRELKNCVARAVILSKQPRLTLADLPRQWAGNAVVGGCPETDLARYMCERGYNLRDMEREIIRAILEHCKGNKSEAASQLGISRKTLYEKLSRYGFNG